MSGLAALGLALTALVAVRITGPSEPARARDPTVIVRPLETDVIPGSSRWARIRVNTEVPVAVTFTVQAGGSEVFRLTSEVEGRFLFEWRGTTTGGDPVAPGRFELVVAAGDHLSTVPLRVSRAGGGGSQGPQPPTGLKVVAAQSNTLTWDRTGDVRVTSYRIYRAQSRVGSYVAVGSTAVGIEAWTDLPSEPGVYWYRLSALAGNAALSESVLSDPVSSDNVHMSQTVGRDGGILSPTTGTVRLEIPPGAVPADTRFTIDQVAAPLTRGAGRVAASRSFLIEPSQLDLGKPATLVLELRVPGQHQLPRNYPQDTTSVRYWNGTRWLTLTGAVADRPSSTIRVPVTTLSTFGATGVTTPHGSYSSQTSLCASCHENHRARLPNLHPYLTERETCYQCHNGGQAAGLGSDEVQRVLVATTMAGIDSFALSFRGETTGQVATPPTADAIDTVLESLATINLGVTPSDNVLVNQAGGSTFAVTFRGALGGTDVPSLSGTATSGSVIVTTASPGRTGLLPGAMTDILGAFGETWPVGGPSTRASLHPVSSAPADGAPQIDCSDCHSPHLDAAGYPGLLRRPDGGGGWLYSPITGLDIGNPFCTSACHDNDSPNPAPFGDHTGFQGTAHDSTQVPTADEVQQVAVDANGGTFTLAFGGESTSPLAFNVDASALASALEALPGIAPGPVAVEGGPGDSGATSPYQVTFLGSMTASDVSRMSVDGAMLSGGVTRTAIVTTVLNGRPAQPLGAIACLNCHDPHGSDSRGLTDAREEALCFSCHSLAEPNTSGGESPPWVGGPFPGGDVQAAFEAGINDYTPGSVRIYHHPIAEDEQAGGTRRVECVSCHNPHLADRTDGDSTSKAVDPADVWSRWDFAWDFSSTYLSRGDNADGFCLQCHRDEPPVAGPAVPYDVAMVDDGVLHDRFDAATWPSSNHAYPDTPETYRGCAATGRSDAECVVTCTSCHDPHGSSNAYMLRETVIPPDFATFTVTSASWDPVFLEATLEYVTPSGLACTATDTSGCTVGLGVDIVVTGVGWPGYGGSFTTTNDAEDDGGPITFDLATDPGGSGPSGGTVTPPASFTMTGFDGSPAFDTILRSWCLTCHIERGTDHESGSCIACHTHEVLGVGEEQQL